MQINLSPRFAATRADHRQASAALALSCETDGVDETTLQALSDENDATLDALLLSPAETAFAVGIKLELIEGREIRDWQAWPMYREALDRDLLDLRRPAATIREQFDAWRAAYKAHVDCTESDGMAAELSEIESAATRALFSAPCASPGDFLLKAYVLLLNECGSTGAQPAGSKWDVDITKADHPQYVDQAWQRAAYHDLNMSDLGACLLAFGRLEFSAADWLERAHSLGIPIGLHIEGASEPTLRIGLYHGDMCERRQRERSRLDRLLAFDASRLAAIAHAILNEWPDLVTREAA